MPTFPAIDRNPLLKDALRTEFRLMDGDKAILGPTDASKIHNDAVAATLFDIDNQSFKSLIAGRSLIVGRRGAGKSALLHTYRQRPLLYERLKEATQSYSYTKDSFELLSKFDLIIEIKTFTQLESMQLKIARQYPDNVEPAVESLAEQWRDELWVLVLKEVIRQFRDTQKGDSRIRAINDFAGWSFLTERERISIDGAHRGVNRSRPVPTLTGRWDDELAKAIAAAKEFIREKQLHGVILFDSMEEYTITNRPSAHTLKGLLRCIWEHFNKTDFSDHLQIRFCLPSEIYNYLGDRISSSRGKDFASIDFIQWSPLELFRIAAHRYSLLLYLYDPLFFNSQIAPIDLSTRTGIHEFWRKLIPCTITPAGGEKEETIAYIARHTQLLPRQVLNILSIALKRAYNERGSLQYIPPNCIHYAAEAASETNVSDIFDAFRCLYPSAREVVLFQVCGRLTNRLSYGRLYTVWRETAKATMELMNKPEFFHFWNMLFEMGLLGRVYDGASQERGRYTVGHFSYNEASRIIVGDKDEVCVHPLLSKYLRGKPDKSDCEKARQPVYPRGSGL